MKKLNELQLITACSLQFGSCKFETCKLPSENEIPRVSLYTVIQCVGYVKILYRGIFELHLLIKIQVLCKQDITDLNLSF